MILLENDTSPNAFRNQKNECKTVEATVTGLVTVHCICSSQSACKSLQARSWPGPVIASQSHIWLSSLYVVTGPSDWFNSTDTTESLLLTLSKILVADVLCTRDSLPGTRDVVPVQRNACCQSSPTKARQLLRWQGALVILLLGQQGCCGTVQEGERQKMGWKVIPGATALQSWCARLPAALLRP